MTSRDFCFWLQGFFELARTPTLSETQVSMIERHLALVFKHEIDPSMGEPAKQAMLNEIHGSGPTSYGPFPESTIGGEVSSPQGPIRYRC